MRKLFLVMIVIVLLMGMTACSTPAETNDESATQTEKPEPTPEPQPDWEYDEGTKTLYVNADMGAFEADAPDFDGTTSNAPWAEHLPEIENIVIGDDVTCIGDYALAFCTNLKSVEVGKNVASLDFRCFFKCGDFENGSNIDMYFNSTPAFGEDVFGWTWENPNVVIYVPDDMKEYWADFIMQKGQMKLDGYDLQQPLDKDRVLFSMLQNPQELWYEGSQGFSENDGGQFGGGVTKGYNADMQRLEIFGEDTGACSKFNTSLKTCMSDVGMDKVPQQAVLVKFSASDITEARISFDALDEIDFWFEDGGVKFVDVANFFEMPITDFMPNNLELKNDTIYNFFFAFDAEGNIRMFVWEDGSTENQAYFEYDLYQDAADINNCDLIMHLAVGANEQFNLYEYWIYTFYSFMDNSTFISSGDNQNGDMQNADEDYGPYWTINIAGNFEIYSDMVWQEVEPQAFNIGSGDTFMGYVLKDLMEFSGNGSDIANVFFEDGSEVEVNPTFDAFVVYKQNDEFMGGVYLLSMSGLSELPITSVQPK